jgi:hypothetical protein
MSEEDLEQPLPDIRLGCEPPTRRIVDRLDEPLQNPGECRLYRGRPCLLFEDWDYAEDWSGEYVRVIAPQPLTAAGKLSTAEFWALVRKLHALS